MAEISGIIAFCFREIETPRGLDVGNFCQGCPPPATDRQPAILKARTA